MPTVFDGAKLVEGDSMFVVGLGPAQVIDATHTYFRIRVGGRTKKVSYTGVLSGQTFPSVFWRDPILCRPAKSAVLWNAMKALALSTCAAFQESVKNQDLTEVFEPELVEVAAVDNPANQINSQALEHLLEQAARNNGDSLAGVAAGG